MQQSLFPGESIQVAEADPGLRYVKNRKSDFPLVAFVSGGPTMSRIA